MMFDMIRIFLLAGLFVLVLDLVLLILSRSMSRCKVEDHCCRSCANYETCAEVMRDTLPGSCAYWQKKKP